MATIRARRRQDGSLACLAEVRVKHEGRLVHRECKTFDKRRAASEWANALEKELSKSNGVVSRQHQALVRSLRRILAKYRKEVSEVRTMGRSKTAHIKFLENTELASLDVRDIRTRDLIEHVRAHRKAGAGPSTVNNDIVWLRVILRYARAAWEFPFDLSIIDDAYSVLRAEKLVSKSRVRTRRPTSEELTALTDYSPSVDYRNYRPRNATFWPRLSLIPLTTLSQANRTLIGPRQR